MTAQTTIEALLYELRRGLAALAEHGTRSRLSRCDKAAIRQVAARLQPASGGPFDPTWSAADVQTLVLEWQTLKGKRSAADLGTATGVGKTD